MRTARTSHMASHMISRIVSQDEDDHGNRSKASASAAVLDQAELILNSIVEGVHVIDAQGLITFVNTPAVEMLGWGEDDVIGRDQHGLIHHTHADGTPYRATVCPILTTLHDGRTRREDGDIFWRKDGTSLPVDYIITPICRERRVVGAVVAFRDITERRQAIESRELLERHAEELTRMTHSLARVNRELDQFAYVASHDLKAPLRGIASLASWIEDDLRPQLSDQTKQHLALLRSRILRMEALIDGLLQYSRAGRLQSRIEEVPVAALLTEIAETLGPPAGAVIDVGPMPTLHTERVPLERVFFNLLGNALKHSNRPDTHVSVRAHNRDRFYEFVVQDDGPGIPKKFHSRIWEIFQTLQPRDKVEGAGIGLALVKKNVEARGGKVWLDSDEGRGAAFHFLWPKLIKEEG